METVVDFILGGSKITPDGDCSHEIKRLLFLGRKTMANLDSTLKSRDITLPTKVRLVKAMVFPVVMYGCESWTITKAECQRIDGFEPWCWRRLLRATWTVRRSNQWWYKALVYSFPNLEPSVVRYSVLTVAAWSTYRFLRKQIRWLVWYSHLLKNFQQSRNRCVSRTLLLFRWCNRCWQFDLWFLCLF